MESIKTKLLNAIGDTMSKHSEDQFGCFTLIAGEPSKPAELILEELGD